MKRQPNVFQNGDFDSSWLPLILENSSLLVGYIGSDKKHRYVNTAYCQWFQKKPEEILNKTLQELAHEPESYAAVEPYETRALNGEQVKFDIRLPEPELGQIDSFTCNFVPHFQPDSSQVLGVAMIAEMFTRQEKAIKDKEGTEQKFRDLTNTIPQLLWTAKANGEVDYVNQRCLDFTGKTIDFYRTTWHENLHPDDAERVAGAWFGSMASGTPFKEEYRLRKVDNTYQWFMGHAVPIFNSENEVEYWIGTATNIEAERRRSDDLNKAKIAAEDASRSKTAFLANMSHELRTPLGAVLGFSNLLANENLSPKDRQLYNEVIERNGKMLTRIIDDLLDMSRIEAGRMVIEYLRFSPADLLNDIIKIFKDSVDEKHIRLTLTIDDNMPKSIVSDPVRLRQILINVIGNGVKFTERGSVDVRAFALDGANGGVELSFEVEDTGCGISEEQSRQLFSPFYQADSSSSRLYGGAGLGLSISKRLAEALGGDIQIKKFGVNQGCTFVVTISEQLEDKGTKASTIDRPKVVDSMEGPLQGRRLLVVDDSADNLFLTKQILESNGGNIDTSGSGSEAIEKLKTNNYDLILLDIQMPSMDGYESLKAIRESGCDTPAVAISAHAMDSDVLRSKEAGFIHHLAKPLNSEELVVVAKNC